MSDRQRAMYVSSVSGNTVTLSPLPGNLNALGPAGTGIAQLTIKTTESTADPSFWGSTTAQCARFIARFQKHG